MLLHKSALGNAVEEDVPQCLTKIDLSYGRIHVRTSSYNRNEPLAFSFVRHGVVQRQRQKTNTKKTKQSACEHSSLLAIISTLSPCLQVSPFRVRVRDIDVLHR